MTVSYWGEISRRYQTHLGVSPNCKRVDTIALNASQISRLIWGIVLG